MAANHLQLELTPGAHISYSTLNADDRRLVDGWFEHLRNWRTDDYIRAHSRRLDSDDETYAFESSTGLIIAFKISGKKLTVVAIVRKEALERIAEPTTA